MNTRNSPPRCNQSWSLFLPHLYCLISFVFFCFPPRRCDADVAMSYSTRGKSLSDYSVQVELQEHDNLRDKSKKAVLHVSAARSWAQRQRKSPILLNSRESLFLCPCLSLRLSLSLAPFQSVSRLCSIHFLLNITSKQFDSNTGTFDNNNEIQLISMHYSRISVGHLHTDRCYLSIRQVIRQWPSTTVVSGFPS